MAAIFFISVSLQLRGLRFVKHSQNVWRLYEKRRTRQHPGRPAPLLEVDNVTLQYKTREHLVTATYRVELPGLSRPTASCCSGPSGCGKSTLLKAVGGFMKPVEGEHPPQRASESTGPAPTA